MPEYRNYIIFHIKTIPTKNSYKRRASEAVAEKQQFNSTRTKIPPSVSRGNGRMNTFK